MIEEMYRMEFASPAWMDFFGKLLVARAFVMDTPSGTTCEVYLNVPPHISPGGSLAWTRHVAARSATFTLTECPDETADVKIRGDYAALLPLSRHVIGDNPAPFDALMANAVASGAVTIVKNNRDPNEPRDYTVHDMMAVLTR